MGHKLDRRPTDQGRSLTDVLNKELRIADCGRRIGHIEKGMSLDFAAVRAAHERIRPHIHRTPVLTSARLDAASGASLFFKCENFQKGGAFKARGATNAVFLLDDGVAPRGVATHSSGNHGSAVARAAKLRGIPAHIVVPSNSAKVKVRAVESYGAHIVFCEPTEAAREFACADVIAKTGATDSFIRKRRCDCGAGDGSGGTA